MANEFTVCWCHKATAQSIFVCCLNKVVEVGTQAEDELFLLSPILPKDSTAPRGCNPRERA